VNVVVNARTPDEFTAVNSLLLSFQKPPTETKTAYVARVAEDDGGEMHQLEVPRSEVHALVAQLNDRAPQNVLIEELAETDAEAAAERPVADERGRLGAESAARKKPAPSAASGVPATPGAGGGRSGGGDQDRKARTAKQAERGDAAVNRDPS